MSTVWRRRRGPADRSRRAHPGFANVALLRRLADLDEETWLTSWHDDHIHVAIDTKSAFGYPQNGGWFAR